ncbi:hypothetical protein NM208_g2615 [Fusarium decemcellulare]|uniref:Uncharacterized protein n=1 Tax=Fusarium decemcellulare TaxID=57161 RepID=A0ACC1SRU1_9HYPO|nr:hypothetical protein NM208_g2615 [Fusarium decemcellulare]
MSTQEVTPLTSGQAMAKKRGRGRRPKAQPANNKQRQPQSGMLQFINTIQPDDATSNESLSLIRAHVARHSRAVQREKKQPQCAKRVSFSNRLPIRGLVELNDENEEEECDSHENDGTRSSRAPRIRPGTKSAYRKLAPKRRTSIDLARSRSSSPIQLIGGAQKHAYQGFARSLSEDEQYLFDFYVDYVVQYGYKACYHKEDEKLWQASMRDDWVPFAMGQPSLMAAIFHVACRNYAIATSNTISKKFSIKKLQYRLTCLQMAKEAIASQTMATDATIALALIMASESFYEGDFDAFTAHGSGIIKMVTARGGLDTLGVSGFLTKGVGWSIYSPRHYLVQGPRELELQV